MRKLRPNRCIRSTGNLFTQTHRLTDSYTHTHAHTQTHTHTNTHTHTHTQTDTQTNCCENITPPRFLGGVMTSEGFLRSVMNKCLNEWMCFLYFPMNVALEVTNMFILSFQDPTARKPLSIGKLVSFFSK